MTTRWWAPAAEAAPLDETVRAMLTPGEDPTAELGLYLLAAHRAGAGGLTEVSKSQLSSADSLVRALADVRADLAPLMVDAITPLRGAKYAGLFVRDVLDDADRGALDVFRTAVSKGVPPPVAMERAAAGYGMPMREMGKFAALATDAKANPRAVIDAADRSLMAYVKRIAEAETDSVVSKAGPPQRAGTATQTEWDESEHPRGTDGRFVDAPPAVSPSDRIRQRLGLTSEPARVGSTVRERRARRSRQQAQRQAATRSAAQTQATTQAQPRQAKPRQAVRQATTTAAARHAYAQSLTEGQAAPEAAQSKSDKPAVTPQLLETFKEAHGVSYYPLGQSVVVGTGQGAGAGIRMAAGDQAMLQKDPTAMIFRMGHLLEVSRYVEAAGAAQREAQDGSATSEVMETMDDHAEPIILPVTHAEITGDYEGDRAYLEHRKEDLAQRTVRLPGGGTRKITDHDELNHIQVYPVYRPYDEVVGGEESPQRSDIELVIVHAQAADPKNPGRRPVPIVDEYVIDTEAQGYESAVGSRGQEIVLDPNQAYRIVPAPHAPAGALARPERMFDVENHVVVNRWYLAPISEDEVDDIMGGGVGKALTPQQRAEFETLHPRDESGQFTRVSDRVRGRLIPAELADSKKAPRKFIQVRQRRSRQQAQRQATRIATPRAAAPQQGRPQQAQRQAARQAQIHPQVRAAVRQAIARIAEEREHLPDLPVLHDVSDYRLASERAFQNIFEDFDPEQFKYLHAKPGRAIGLMGYERLMLLQNKPVDADVMLKKLVYLSHDAVREAQAPAEIYGELELGAVPDDEHIAARIKHALEVFEPDVLDIVHRSVGKIELHGYRAKEGPINLIESDPDMDPDQPMELVYLGEHRARDITMRMGDIEGNMLGDLERFNDAYPSAIPNAPMHLYRIQNPRIRRYGVRNP